MTRIVCPICRAVIPDAPDDFEPRPFCSNRCKLIDLSNWLNEAYRIPTDASDGNESPHH